MKCVPVHHGIPALLHRDEPWLHRHSENGASEGPIYFHCIFVCMKFFLNVLKKLFSRCWCFISEDSGAVGRVFDKSRKPMLL